MKNINKGFTLVEVVITIIIIGILSLVGGSAYKRHLDNAKYNEGLRLVQSLKEQEDLSLTFASSDTTKNPFFYTSVWNTTYTIDRNAQKLGKFHIYPQNNKYFTSFLIREPQENEKIQYDVAGHGYVIEAYCLDSQLTLKLIGSSEGPYTVVRE